MKAHVQNPRKNVDPKKTIRKELNFKVLNWAVSGAFALFVLYMALGQNHDFLRKLQDLDLFIYNRQFFIDSMQRVGGLSMYLGSFFYQFFYYPWIGSLLLLLLLSLVGFLTAKTFNLKGLSFPLAFIPSLALLLCMTELGYMIYFQKIDGYVYTNIIGVLIILTGLMIFQKIHKLPAKMIFVITYLIISYPACGAYSLFGSFLMLLVSLKNYFEHKQRESIILALTIVLSLLLIPIFYYRVVFDQLSFGTIYTANLPYFTLKGAEKGLWLPFLMLIVFFIYIVLLKNGNDLSKKKFFVKLLPTFLFILSLTTVFVFSFKDKNFYTELSMQAAADNEDWNEVLKIARKQEDEPTRIIVMNTNLALYKLGLATDKMFHYKNGDKKINSPRPIVSIQIGGTMLYYQYGELNYCNKWCMESMVEYGLSVSVLKYFVLSSLLNGEIDLSKKYNDVLKSTLFYRSWALKNQKYMDHPESIAKAEEFRNILTLTTYDDELDIDYSNVEAFLRNHFAYLREVPKELTELSVLFNLDLKNIERFWPRLFRWVRFYPTKKVPVHFQEAALLYEHLEHKVDLTGAPFDNTIRENFKNFQDMVQQSSNYPEESMKKLFYNQYGNTFWYYYFFVKEQEPSKKDEKGYKN